MLKNIIIIILGIVTAFQLHSAEPLAAYKQGDLWYFLDDNGEFMFDPIKVGTTAGYKNGFFVNIDTENDKEKWWVMNREGKKVFDLDASAMRYFSDDGLAMIINYEKPTDEKRYYGFVDTTGKVVVEPKYLSATDFVNGSSWVFSFEERGYINPEGEIFLPTENAYGYNFFEGFAALQDTAGQHGFINEKGEMVIESQYDEVRRFSEGLCAVNINGKFGFINAEGELVIPALYEFASDFHDGVCFVARATQSYQPIWGLINKQGITVVDFYYQMAKDFEDGVGLVKRDDEYFFIDTFGNNYLDRTFAFAEQFKNGLAWVYDKETNTRGFIDPLGNFIFKFPEAEIYVDLRTNRRVF